MTVSVPDVQARWAYSEIADGTLSHFYDNGRDTEALRERRRAGVPFDQLGIEERYNLAFQCVSVRQNLVLFFTGIEAFDLVQLTRAELGNLFVPPNVWRDSQGMVHPFAHYIGTQTNESGDARLLGAPPGGYQAPADPLAVGRYYEHRLLLDGYHRAALFWKYGPPDGTLPVYMPRP